MPTSLERTSRSNKIEDETPDRGNRPRREYGKVNEHTDWAPQNFWLED
jgi:hypothetical protein